MVVVKNLKGFFDTICVFYYCTATAAHRYCCLGNAPRAQLLWKGAWPLHLKRQQGSTASVKLCDALIDRTKINMAHDFSQVKT